MKTVLTISNSDSSGAEGIQADIKTLTAHGVYATSVITAVAAQNEKGITDSVEMTPQILNAQLDAVFNSVHPDAVKIGMISSPMLIYNLVQKLKEYNAQNIVVDPVALTIRDTALNKSNTLRMIKRYLLNIATVITPGIAEAEIIAFKEIHSKYDMSTAAKLISDKYNCPVLVKGADTVADADDVLYYNGKHIWLDEKNYRIGNARGLGATLASAIAANMAKGHNAYEAICLAKEYLTCAVASMCEIGDDLERVNHSFDSNSRFIK